jgi:endoribonuclease LACTB2
VLETQVSAIQLMKSWIKPRDQYLDITMHDNMTISFAESRTVLDRIGIAGELLHTPGHSDDSARFCSTTAMLSRVTSRFRRF